MTTLQELTDALEGATTDPDAAIIFKVDGTPADWTGASVEGGQVTIDLVTTSPQPTKKGSSSSSSSSSS